MNSCTLDFLWTLQYPSCKNVGNGRKTKFKICEGKNKPVEDSIESELCVKVVMEIRKFTTIYYQEYMQGIYYFGQQYA